MIRLSVPTAGILTSWLATWSALCTAAPPVPPPTGEWTLLGRTNEQHHYMPELSWRYGYQFGLALIVASTILPILWFKWRGWW